ncbi:diguanylate cyclase [Vibrio genomosp. F10 str. ZF-129]|uniref:cyclic-guanylate-specific phosphodiesterase n=1 Tax=Vibrio genomosp. F10 str. ZF-129 TaxID=1187848 RepID=A0A1E5BAB9_9VIBR|nr:EAL domain-containing protein [Vibrio genomosp. F10]OEE30860.1 diguanylate cyclase [Vibrio genomosp. F10 str. ZF-129]
MKYNKQTEASPSSLLHLARKNIRATIPIGIIFVSVFTVSAIVNFYTTNNHAKTQGKQSIHLLEQYIGETAKNLMSLKNQVSSACERDDVLAIRGHVFHSTMLKEIGLYKDGVVFCTSNEGAANIRLSSSILQRLEDSSNNITISLTISKSRLQTFFIFAHDENDSGAGANALLAPNQFLGLVSPDLSEQEFGYTITVLSQTIQSGEGSVDSAVRLFSFSSHLYPLSITLHLNHASYLYHFGQHFWQTLLIAAMLSLVYLAIRNYRITRQSLEYSLLQAIDDGDLKLYLQPIVDIVEKRIAGSEALIRWHHRSQGIIPPDMFIPLAERMGVIDQITKLIIKSVTSFIYTHQKELKGQYISLNISRQLIIDSDFIDYLIEYSKRHPDIVPILLLEITENNDYTNRELDHATFSLSILSDLGFKVAVDDFGTGYSGLNFIRQHPFNALKIDKVFVNGLRSETAITPVLISMINLGDELNMKVIAEGVETREQIEQLSELGIRYIQGYYFSAPMKPKEFIKFKLI